MLRNMLLIKPQRRGGQQKKNLQTTEDMNREINREIYVN